VNHRRRIFVALALAMGLLVPVALAQKPPAPAPAPPPSPAPSRPVVLTPSNSQPGESEADLVMFLLGSVSTNDGTALPNDVLVERVCNDKVRQQVYTTSRGSFSMQMGSMADSYLDASGERTPQDGVAGESSRTGISRRELANCDLRASASGFHSTVISLMDRTTSGGSIDVGAIVVQRTTKIEGMTLSAAPYKAPKDARRAFEKGLEAERNGKLAKARQCFELAVEIYPRYANAWFQLGSVLQKESHNDAARMAYIQSTTIDAKFLPPYLSLASMAYEAKNWPEVLKFSGHIMDLDPLNKANVTGYILDLDPLDSAEAYFYNAVANYKLNNMEDAEKSALKAEHVDLRTRFPQLHLLLAELFTQKSNYATAISEIQLYLELVPHAQDVDQVREELARLEKLNGSMSIGEKSNEN
jgi:tetratricopeptide (TPR) repeat protein